MDTNERSVAIIGAGPGGLVAAKYLRSEGFEPVIFEQSHDIGGQWHGNRLHSGVWPGLRTNTSRILTSFSDLSHDDRLPVYPTQQDLHAYLLRYAAAFDLVSCIRRGTRVTRIDRADGGWAVHRHDPGGTDATGIFARVVVATGRHHEPTIPHVRGLESFAGTCGAIHTFAYEGPDAYRRRHVLVCGGSISALEIAGELAAAGADRVVSATRRQRYVMQKLLAGVPADHLAFTRFGALAEESLPADIVAQGFKELILRTSGSPEQYGTRPPADNVLEAGVTLSQQFLPLVAEGRIECRSWPREVRGRSVLFEDGRSEQFDGLIFGTGYRISLPFVDAATRLMLDADSNHLDVYGFTFHPDLPGLAFLGLFELVGPYFPVLELQARWIAYAWSGAQPMPSSEEMRAALARYRSRRRDPELVPMHTAAIFFSRQAGSEPELDQWPRLARPLLFGPLTPVSFRLNGRDALSDGVERVWAEARAFGALPTSELTAEQCGQLQALAAARNDARFRHFVDQLTIA
jgi:hypothetical protein